MFFARNYARPHPKNAKQPGEPYGQGDPFLSILRIGPAGQPIFPVCGKTALIGQSNAVDADLRGLRSGRRVASTPDWSIHEPGRLAGGYGWNSCFLRLDLTQATGDNNIGTYQPSQTLKICVT